MRDEGENPADLSEMSDEERAPFKWAITQYNLGAALQALGQRESGTAHIEEAVAAYRAALEERTRERVPYASGREIGSCWSATKAIESAERRRLETHANQLAFSGGGRSWLFSRLREHLFFTAGFTICLASMVVQNRLGHSSVMMTMDIYGHLFPQGDDYAKQIGAAERALLAKCDRHFAAALSAVAELPVRTREQQRPSGFWEFFGTLRAGPCISVPFCAVSVRAKRNGESG
jgi:tetratricopeptide (TPR) repeat protein